MEDFIYNYGLIILAALITLIARCFINISYAKYKKVPTSGNLTGKDIARYILDKNGLSNVKITQVGGSLTDHYDPSNKEVRLSESVYNQKTVAAIAVAAHECGHAIQDKTGYFMLRLRCSLVPLVNFSSYAGYIAITIGIFAGLLNLIWIGIILEMVILLFQLVTLPVEINASKRALKELKQYDLITKKEVSGSRTMLVAAASTYVASLASTLLQILRLILIFGRRRK